MIRIIYRRGRCVLQLSGHAMYAQKGQDIVCAGVSALCETLAMHRFMEHRTDGDEYYIRAAPGKFWAARPIMEAFVAGFEAIGKQYPDYISFTSID